MPNQRTYQAVRTFTKILGADLYDIRIVDGTLRERSTVYVHYTLEQINDPTTLNYLSYKNRDQFHIYCRPIGHQYFLVDDITEEHLPLLAQLHPCLLFESSPKNYQAWLKLAKPPSARSEAVNLCRTLASYLSADMNAARPEQVGRLPGYTNCKEKYRQSNGYFPYVRLRKWKDRYATFHPLEGAACKIMRFEDSNLKQPTKSNHYQPTASNHWQPKTTKYQVKSQSHIDFRIACDMVRAGSSDIDIHLRLEKNLQLPGRTKKTKSYISTTIRNARKAVGVGQ